MEQDQDLQIGIATVQYDEQGKVTHARFKPTLEITVSPLLKDMLKDITATTDKETTLHNAEAAFASWFSKMTEIELADRDEYEIAVSNTTCHKHSNGIVSACYISFVFRKKNK